MAYKGIGEYGIIGNSCTAALVGIDGSIDWCCLPRLDSPSVFAAILDDEKGGSFGIKPTANFKSQQAYLEDTNVLETAFQTQTGEVTLTDFMPCYETPQRRLIQLNELHRQVSCTKGQVEMEVLFKPRPNYARDRSLIRGSKHGLLASQGTGALVLSSPTPFTISRGRATARFTLAQGEKTTFVLHHGSGRLLAPVFYRTTEKLERTAAYWRSEARGCQFTGIWRDAIVRSYLALHLLLYSPSGAIVAAPTTSLPERIGGERNWDYRFTWLRDASLTLNAFFHLGHQREAAGFFRWLLAACVKCGARTQILYGIDFQDPPGEEKLEHLKGYRNSRPVRIGNDAYQQTQLDVFGEVLEAAYNYLNIGGHISHRTWQLLARFIDAACSTWQQPDYGIWEVRGKPRHFVYSKMMCWVALDRGIKIAQRLGHRKNLRRWQKTAQAIRESILTRGWHPERQAFTQHYDTTALDSSNLLLPLFGFLPASDERILATIKRTVSELDSNGLLLRYRTEETDDGLKGVEGAFLMCSFWLARNLLRLGKLDDAAALYQKLLGLSNHLGLFAEMADPATGEALGNFPQALTHLAVIITGLELTQAMEESRGQPLEAKPTLKEA